MNMDGVVLGLGFGVEMRCWDWDCGFCLGGCLVLPRASCALFYSLDSEQIGPFFSCDWIPFIF